MCACAEQPRDDAAGSMLRVVSVWRLCQHPALSFRGTLSLLNTYYFNLLHYSHRLITILLKKYLTIIHSPW